MGQVATSPADAYLRPPRRMRSHVLAFCSRISPGRTPIYITARSMPGTSEGMCFRNVRRLCERQGGTAEYGWLIWEWEETYIEAEHHAAWLRDGELIEVTPRRPHHERVLFLPDPDRSFDFETRRRLDNIRMPLRGDGNVREYLSLAARGVAIEEAAAAAGGHALGPEQARALEEIWLRMRIVEAELAEWSLRRMGRNAPCWCGSGRKLKKCNHQSRTALDLQTV